ncbi:putative ribonuclease H-like domain-containing protein [Tanacetum coccineum]
MQKMYCLVVTDDFSRFSWVFFLATKDETNGILKAFITGIENQMNHRVKIIRCDNGIEFKNKEMNQFCEMKGIKREFSIARTPQQNGVAKRKNRTLIEAAKTMLADSKLPTTFWAEAVNTACYVQNRVLVIKPHNKTPYELFLGRKPTLSFMRPFGCPVTILNTLDHLGKFDGKADEGFFVGYSVNSKAFRVFNSRTRIVEETLHITFLENKPNVAGSGPTWLFDIDTLTKSMNYKPIVARNQSNGNAGTKENINAGQARKKIVPGKDYILLPLWTQDPPFSFNSKDSPDTGFKPSGEEDKKDEEIDYLNNAKDVGAEADMTYLDTHIPVSPIPTTKLHKDHPLSQILRDIMSHPQTRRMTRNVTEHEEPKKVIQALIDPSWIEAMQDELLQFKLQKMDVKSAFLYGNIEEEVYVCQPLRFEDPEFPDRVYKVEKALYGLHQAPRAWIKGDILLVQVYVDDIIFGATKELCTEFEKLMHKKFQISSIASTPIETKKPLLKNLEADDVDVHLYRSMIGSLMYLTTSRPDIMFALCACARFQVTPKVSHLHAVKRIFRYLKGQPKLGLWYPKDSPFDLKAYSDSDYAGASLDRKSTTGGVMDLKSNAGLWIQLHEY